MTGKQKKTNSQTNDAQIPSVRFNEQTQGWHHLLFRSVAADV